MIFVRSFWIIVQTIYLIEYEVYFIQQYWSSNQFLQYPVLQTIGYRATYFYFFVQKRQNLRLKKEDVYYKEKKISLLC